MRMNKILITAATLIRLALPVSGQMSGRATDPAGSMAGGIENGQPGGMAVTIEECHGAAEKYFPLVRQYELTLSNQKTNYMNVESFIENGVAGQADPDAIRIQQLKTKQIDK